MKILSSCLPEHCSSKKSPGRQRNVAREMLAHLRRLLPEKTPTVPVNDHFENYWSKLYGCMEGETWNEPMELPFEKREAW